LFSGVVMALQRFVKAGSNASQVRTTKLCTKLQTLTLYMHKKLFHRGA
jgi:hypothetical protein